MERLNATQIVAAFNQSSEGNSTSSENEGPLLASMDTIKIGIYFFIWIFGLAANFLGMNGC